MTPTWRDEFDGLALDASKWQAPSMGRQGDQSTWHPDRVRVSNGRLHLDARLVSDQAPRYQCGAVRTRADYDPAKTMFQQRYGYFETRARLPRSLRSDAWLAFWIMSGDIRDGQTDSRRGSEIDIVETFRAWDGRLGHAVHWGGYGATHDAFSIESPPFSDLDDGRFHTYGLLWTPEFYAIYRDRRLIGWSNAVGLGKSNASQGTSQEPGYLKLTVEAAPWAGPTGEWEPNPPVRDSAVIDYVRVFEVPGR